MNKTTFICQLSEKIQNDIRYELENFLTKEEVELAMSSRLCDLEEILDVEEMLKRAE